MNNSIKTINKDDNNEEFYKNFFISMLNSGESKKDDIAAELGLWRVWAYHCNRCNYYWLPKDVDFSLNQEEYMFNTKPPKSCARCKSKYWNKLPQKVTKNVDTMYSVARLRAVYREQTKKRNKFV